MVQPTSNKFPSPTRRPPGSTHSILEPSSSTQPRPITTGPAPFEQDIRAPEKMTVSGPMEISPPSKIARAQTTAPAAIRTVESDMPEPPIKNLDLSARDCKLSINVGEELLYISFNAEEAVDYEISVLSCGWVAKVSVRNVKMSISS